MKIRLGNYFIAEKQFVVLKFIWWNIFRRGVVFSKVWGKDYENKEVDIYYLILLK